MKHKKDIKERIDIHNRQLAKLEIDNPKYAKLEYDKASSIDAFKFWEYSIKKQKIEEQIKVLKWVLV